jgi:hypothetical protein
MDTEINVEDFTKAFAELDVDNLEVVEDIEAPAQSAKEEKPEVKPEETAKPEEETEETQEETTKETTDAEPSIYGGIVNLVKEEAGLFSSLEADKITDATQLVEAIRSEINEGVEDYKNSLPEALKSLISNYEEGVPLRDLIEIQSNEIELDSITDEDLEDKQIQKNIYTQYLKSTTKFSDSKIEKEINKLDDLDELGDEVKNALEELKELTKAEKENAVKAAKEARAQEEKARKEQIDNLKKDVEGTQEIIPGVKLNQKEQAELFKQMTTPIGYTADGYPVSKVQEIRAKDPVAFEKTLNYLVMKGVFEKDYSLFKTVEAKGKTSAITEFEKTAKRAVEAKQNGLPAKAGATGLAKNILNAL